MKAPDGIEQRYASNALERALSILEAFTGDCPSLALMDIVRITGINKTTAFRLLSVLSRRGFVSRDPQSGHYSVGIRSLVLADAFRQDATLIRAARPTLDAIRDEVNETTMLVIRWNDFRVDLDQAESRHPIRQVMAAGRQRPLYVGAGGRVLLAGMSDIELESYLDRVQRVQLSPTTLIGRKELLDSIYRIRADGYAESHSEAGTGAAGIAALIRGRLGEPLGAITVSTPEYRFTDELRTRIIAAVLEGVESISRQFGSVTGRVA